MPTNRTDAQRIVDEVLDRRAADARRTLAEFGGDLHALAIGHAQNALAVISCIHRLDRVAARCDLDDDERREELEHELAHLAAHGRDARLRLDAIGYIADRMTPGTLLGPSDDAGPRDDVALSPSGGASATPAPRAHRLRVIDSRGDPLNPCTAASCGDSGGNSGGAA